ncbi:MAG: hypothetical protein ACO1QS_15265 [Verrucomicrobiota bacterium]
MSLASACKQTAAKWLVRPLLLLKLGFRHVRMRWQIACAHQHGAAYELLPEKTLTGGMRSKVVAVVTHVCRPDARDLQKKGAASVERLQSTLEGLLTSFAHCDLHIIINAYRDWEVTGQLPTEIKRRLEVIRHQDTDPMSVGFEVPDIFARYRLDTDWFLHLEDDITIHDATFLDKLAFFNATVNQPKSLLLPNRYESLNGRKYYIDLRWPHEDFRAEAWAAAATFKAAGIAFGQCANSHSGCYVLNRQQLDLWLDSARGWHKQVTGAGPQESWSSTMLNEVFELYKPHPLNLYFLEVRHCHSTYFTRLLKYEQEKQIHIKCETAE